MTLSGAEGDDARHYQERDVRDAIEQIKKHGAMKDADQYHKWVEWSDEDEAYIGRCPDLFMGGCHGDDPTAVFQELCQIVDEWIETQRGSGKPLPPARIKPLAAAA